MPWWRPLELGGFRERLRWCREALEVMVFAIEQDADGELSVEGELSVGNAVALALDGALTARSGLIAATRSSSLQYLCNLVMGSLGDNEQESPMTTTNTARRAEAPDIAVFGYGSPDALHLTIEAQRMLERVGRTFSLGVPAGLARVLRQLRVKVVDLGAHLDAGRPYADAYLDVVDEVLGRATIERPVILLVPGNPMFLDSVTRFLVVAGRKRDLRIDVHAGVSPLDVLISYLGVDVAAFGLQVLTAEGFVTRQIPVNVAVPLVVLELAGIGSRKVGGNGGPAGYTALARHLAGYYPPAHPVTMVNLTAIPGRRSHATRPLERLADFLPHIAMNSHLFVDAVTTASASREEK